MTGQPSEPPSSEPAPSEPPSSEPPSSEPAQAGARGSGLKNPVAAVRGLGAGILIMESIVLLLAIQPVRLFAGNRGTAGVWVVLGLVVAAVLLAGLMGRRWAWHGGSALQVSLLLAGVLHWSLGALGLIFGLAWGYATHVRRTLLAPPRRVSPPPATD